MPKNPRSRRQWASADLERALQAREGGMLLRVVAGKFGIPKCKDVWQAIFFTMYLYSNNL